MRRYLKITLMTVLLPMAAMAARVEVLQDNLDHPGHWHSCRTMKAC